MKNTLWQLTIVIAVIAVIISAVSLYKSLSSSPNESEYHQESTVQSPDDVLKSKDAADDELKGLVVDSCIGNSLQSNGCTSAIEKCSQSALCFQMVKAYQISTGSNSQNPDNKTYLAAALYYINLKRLQVGLPPIDSSGDMISTTPTQ